MGKIQPALGLLLFQFLFGSTDSREGLSPCDIDVFKGTSKALVTEHSGRQLDILDLKDDSVTRSIRLKNRPNASAISPDNRTIYVAQGVGPGSILVIDTESGDIRHKIPVGHTPLSPVVSQDGKKLYVCLRFDNAIGIVDLEKNLLIKTVAVTREPVAAALTPDGKYLYVSNHLPAGRADAEYVAAVVDIIDTESGTARAPVRLPNGSEGLRGICVSPDGKHVFAAHILARYQVPTTQLERGWINTAALSIIRTGSQDLIATVLLDDVTLGFANPWAVACTDEGRNLVVSSAGTHELRIIDLQALLTKIAKRSSGSGLSPENDLTFISDVSRRVRLTGKGPRALAITGNDIYAAEFFSDSLSKMRIDDSHTPAQRIELSSNRELTPEWQGEMLFNDADICFQKWQSCASCHSDDGRVDGLNWDLLNDGIGNPKNVKSLLFAHKTPPAMGLGVRADAETAVRAGIKYIQFAVRPEEEAQAIDAYLKSLQPVPSPRLVKGRLSDAAKHGRKLFKKTGCIDCHSGEYYTDMKQHDVGTGKALDKGKAFDVPTLKEVWRTAPYLHDGRAVTIYDMLKNQNPDDRHGKTAGLSEEDLRALAEYVESL